MWLGLWHKSNSVSSLPPCPLLLLVGHLWTAIFHYKLIKISKCPNSISSATIYYNCPLYSKPYIFYRFSTISAQRPSLSTLHLFLLIYSLIISKHKPAQTCDKTWTAHNLSGLDMEGNCLGEDLPPPLHSHPLPSSFSISFSFLLAASVDLMSVPDVNTDSIYY